MKKIIQVCFLIATVLLTTVNATQVKAQSNKLSSSNSISGVKPQNGKLQIVNDTPYIALVLLFKPGMKQPNRYANIPPCHARRLLNTYSNLWGVSSNNADTRKMLPIAQISNKDIFNQDKHTFVITISSLNQNTSSKRTCRYRLQSQDVTQVDDRATGSRYFKQALVDLNSAKYWQNLGENDKFAQALSGLVGNIGGGTATIENSLGLVGTNLKESLANNDGMQELLEKTTPKNHQKLMTMLGTSFSWDNYQDVCNRFKDLQKLWSRYFALLPQNPRQLLQPLLTVAR